MKTSLTKDEMHDAVVSGVKEALLEMVPDWDSSKWFFKAIQEGVQAAVWQVATNATQMPCADFYDSIKDGVKDAHKEMGCNTSEGD